MSDHEGDLVAHQLTQGNKGARGYFHKRVEVMLRNEQDADKLWQFMRAWWPSYKEGVIRAHQ